MTVKEIIQNKINEYHTNHNICFCCDCQIVELLEEILEEMDVEIRRCVICDILETKKDTRFCGQCCDECVTNEHVFEDEEK